MEFTKPQSWIPIESENVKFVIANRIRKLWNLPHSNVPTFIGSNPVSLLESHVYDFLKREEYVITEKTDGFRFFLCFFVMTNVNTKQKTRITTFINRKMDIYVAPYECILDRPQIYAGTILDGELALNIQKSNLAKRPQYDFLCFDCVASEGRGCTTLPYSQRLELCREALKNIQVTPSEQGLEIIHSSPSARPSMDSIQTNDTLDVTLLCKKTYPLDEMMHVMHDVIPNQSYFNDGLIFTGEHREMMPNRNHFQFKWKSRNQHYVDFLIRPKARKHQVHASLLKILYFEFWCMDKKNLVLYLDYVPLHFSNFCFLGFTDLNDFYKSDYIVEMAHDPDTHTWKPVRLRNDKEFPNDSYTIHITIENIRENLSPEKICSIISSK